MNRRHFLIGTVLAGCTSRFAHAQPKVTVGVLLARPLKTSFYAPPIIRRLGELGFREDAGMVVEHRSADGVPDRFPKLARELVDARCNVVFAVGPEQPVRALQSTASSIPIVFVAVDYDPIERGIVTSLRRPDRNTTGIYVPQGQLASKRLEIMREVLPSARRFLVLSDVFSRDQLIVLRNRAESAGLQLIVIELAKLPYDLEGAFESARQAQVEAMIGLTSPVFASPRQADRRGSVLPLRADRRRRKASCSAQGVRVCGGRCTAAALLRLAAELARRHPAEGETLLLEIVTTANEQSRSAHISSIRAK